MTEKRVPKLRFGEFHEGWIEKLLDDVSSDVAYGMNSAATHYDGINKYLRITDIDEVTRKFSFDSLTSPKGILDDKFLLRDGDILFARTGASVGKSYMYTQRDGKVYFAGFLIKFSIQKDDDARFIFLQTLHSKYAKWVKTVSMRSGQPGINAEEYKTFKFYTPRPKEQKKIADFLSSVDEKISLLQKQKNAWKTYKKGVMQQIFSQKVRFKDDNGQEFSEWHSHTLKQLGETYNGLTGKTAEDFGKEGAAYIPYMNIFSNNSIDIKQLEYVKINPNENQNTAKFGDVFFTTSSETPHEVGMTSVLLNKVDLIYLNSFCFGFRLFNFKTLLPCFARFLFRSEKIRKKISLLAQGSTRFNLSKTELMKMTILLPSSLDEQQKIADFLSSLDDKITALDKQINAAQHWKKGLMQQMFV